jgi:hypothetical protein
MLKIVSIAAEPAEKKRKNDDNNNNSNNNNNNNNNNQTSFSEETDLLAKQVAALSAENLRLAAERDNNLASYRNIAEVRKKKEERRRRRRRYVCL